MQNLKTDKMGKKVGKIFLEEELEEFARTTGMNPKMVQRKFDDFVHAYPDGKISKDHFKMLMSLALPGLKHQMEKLGNHIFRVYDSNEDGYIDFMEFMIVYHTMTEGSIEDILGKLFRLFVKDEDEIISAKKMKHLVKDLYELITVNQRDKTNPNEIAEGLIMEMDKKSNGKISKEEFISACLAKDTFFSKLVTFRVVDIFTDIYIDTKNDSEEKRENEMKRKKENETRTSTKMVMTVKENLSRTLNNSAISTVETTEEKSSSDNEKIIGSFHGENIKAITSLRELVASKPSPFSEVTNNKSYQEEFSYISYHEDLSYQEDLTHQESFSPIQDRAVQMESNSADLIEETTLSQAGNICEDILMFPEMVQGEFEDFVRAHPNGKMSKQHFKKLMSIAFPSLKDKLDKLGNHIFRVYDSNKDGYIDFIEFMVVYNVINEGSVEDIFGKLFRLFDEDGDGFISPEEMNHLIKDLYELIAVDTVTPNEMACGLFKEMDKNTDGKISKDEFISACFASDTLFSKLVNFGVIDILTNISVDTENDSSEGKREKELRSSPKTQLMATECIEPRISTVSKFLNIKSQDGVIDMTNSTSDLIEGNECPKPEWSGNIFKEENCCSPFVDCVGEVRVPSTAMIEENCLGPRLGCSSNQDEEIVAHIVSDELNEVTTTAGDDELNEVTTAAGDDELNEVPTAAGDDELNEVTTAAGDDALNEVTTAAGDDALNEVGTAAGDDELNDVATAAGDDELNEIATAVGDDELNEVTTAARDDELIEVTTAAGDDALNEVTTTAGDDGLNVVATAAGDGIVLVDDSCPILNGGIMEVGDNSSSPIQDEVILQVVEEFIEEKNLAESIDIKTKDSAEYTTLEQESGGSVKLDDDKASLEPDTTIKDSADYTIFKEEFCGSVKLDEEKDYCHPTLDGSFEAGNSTPEKNTTRAQENDEITLQGATLEGENSSNSVSPSDNGQINTIPDFCNPIQDDTNQAVDDINEAADGTSDVADDINFPADNEAVDDLNDTADSTNDSVYKINGPDDSTNEAADCINGAADSTNEAADNINEPKYFSEDEVFTILEKEIGRRTLPMPKSFSEEEVFDILEEELQMRTLPMPKSFSQEKAKDFPMLEEELRTRTLPVPRRLKCDPTSRKKDRKIGKLNGSSLMDFWKEKDEDHERSLQIMNNTIL